jgi:hypothetical protein
VVEGRETTNKFEEMYIFEGEISVLGICDFQ